MPGRSRCDDGPLPALTAGDLHDAVENLHEEPVPAECDEKERRGDDDGEREQSPEQSSNHSDESTTKRMFRRRANIASPMMRVCTGVSAYTSMFRT